MCRSVSLFSFLSYQSVLSSRFRLMGVNREKKRAEDSGSSEAGREEEQVRDGGGVSVRVVSRGGEWPL